MDSYFSLFVLVAIALGIWWYWDAHVKKVPLAEFGMDSVQRVLKFEPSHVRSDILKRGWMTSAEWLAINKRQVKAIEAELRRRGAEKN